MVELELVMVMVMTMPLMVMLFFVGVVCGVVGESGEGEVKVKWVLSCVVGKMGKAD